MGVRRWNFLLLSLTLVRLFWFCRALPPRFSLNEFSVSLWHCCLLFSRRAVVLPVGFFLPKKEMRRLCMFYLRKMLWCNALAIISRLLISNWKFTKELNCEKENRFCRNRVNAPTEQMNVFNKKKTDEREFGEVKVSGSLTGWSKHWVVLLMVDEIEMHKVEQ